LTEYLAALKRINEAMGTLKKSNLRSSQKAVGQMVCIHIHVPTTWKEIERIFG
jgi:hypothetical protein